jgi:hypothetical protein
MNMAGHSVIRHDKSMLHKWFGPNRSTHWTIAGAVAVIILGSYLVYSNRGSNPSTAATISAAEGTPAPAAPAPPAPLTSGK